MKEIKTRKSPRFIHKITMLERNGVMSNILEHHVYELIDWQPHFTINCKALSCLSFVLKKVFLPILKDLPPFPQFWPIPWTWHPSSYSWKQHLKTRLSDHLYSLSGHICWQPKSSSLLDKSGSLLLATYTWNPVCHEF